MQFDPLCWQAKIVPIGSSSRYRKVPKICVWKEWICSNILMGTWYRLGESPKNYFALNWTCYYFLVNFTSPVLNLQDSSEGKLRSWCLSHNLVNVGRSKSHGQSACSMADLHKSKPTKVNCKPRQDFSFQPSYASPSNESECVLFTNLFGLECKGENITFPRGKYFCIFCVWTVLSSHIEVVK